MLEHDDRRDGSVSEGTRGDGIVKIKKPKNDYDDYPIVTTIPDVEREPKLVLCDQYSLPLQRKIGYK